MPSLKRYTKTSMLIKNTVKQIPRAEASSEEKNPAQERGRERGEFEKNRRNLPSFMGSCMAVSYHKK